MSASGFRTVVQNNGPSRILSYLPPHGVFLDSNATATFRGMLDTVIFMTGGAEAMAAYTAELLSDAITVTYYAHEVNLIDGPSGIGPTVLSPSDMGLTALVTTGDGDPACATGLTGIPISGGEVIVFVNGLKAQLAANDSERLSSDCYLSADGGTTAKTSGTFSTGDVLFWNGTIAGYELSTSDKLDFVYSVLA